MANSNRDRDDMARRGAQNRAEGKVDDIKGRAKDAFGGLTGDTGKQAEGKWDRMKGKAKDAMGRAQQDVSRRQSEREARREGRRDTGRDRDAR